MATTTMSNIEGALGSVISALSEENYERSLSQYCFLFEIAQAHSQIPPDLIFNSIRNPIRNRELPSHDNQDIIYPASPLILRFAGDVESDSILASHSVGLRGRLCTCILREFFDHGLRTLYRGQSCMSGYMLDVNLIAYGANLGCVEETAIRKQIIQFLIRGTNPAVQNYYQGFALCVLFKIAGATFEAYADSSVVDRCFELLKIYDCDNYAPLKQIKVSGLYDECLIGAKANFRKR